MGSIRSWLNEHAGATTILAVLLLAGSVTIALMVVRSDRTHHRVGVYFLDLDSGRSFVAQSDQVPPIIAPSQAADATQRRGVRLFLFACGACPSDLAGLTLDELRKRGVQVGWVERYTEEARRMLDMLARGEAPPGDPVDPMVLDQGRQIADPGQSGDRLRWLKPTDRGAAELMQRVQQQCPSGEQLQMCMPGRD